MLVSFISVTYPGWGIGNIRAREFYAAHPRRRLDSRGPAAATTIFPTTGAGMATGTNRPRQKSMPWFGSPASAIPAMPGNDTRTKWLRRTVAARANTPVHLDVLFFAMACSVRANPTLAVENDSIAEQSMHYLFGIADLAQDLLRMLSQPRSRSADGSEFACGLDR